MVHVEKLGKAWNVHIRSEDPETEFSLIACGLMERLTPEEMHKLVDKVAEHQEEILDMAHQQLNLFHLRLCHLMELNGTNLQDLIKDLDMSVGDAYDISHGSAPSMDTIEAICKKFGVDNDYLFKAL